MAQRVSADRFEFDDPAHEDDRIPSFSLPEMLAIQLLLLAAGAALALAIGGGLAAPVNARVAQALSGFPTVFPAAPGWLMPDLVAIAGATVILVVSVVVFRQPSSRD